LQVVGPPDSSDDDENEKKEGNDQDWEWDFGEDKQTVLPTKKPDKENRKSYNEPKEYALPEKSTSDPKKESNKKTEPSSSKTETKLTTSSSNTAPTPSATQEQQKPSALTSVIYPVLSKLLKQHQDEQVIAALAQLKIAFDNAERSKPGITHSLIAHIIETLKR